MMPAETATPAHHLNPSAWIENHYDYLTNVALGKVRHRSQVEDLIQDTMLAAWKARTRFEGKASERTWLTRILLNKIADHYRSRGRKPSVALSQLGAEDGEDGDLLDALMQSQQEGEATAEPLAQVERAEVMEMIEQSLENVPEQAARAFRMRELQGMSTDDIANELGITPNHLWVLIHRARKALRSQLEAMWGNALENAAQPGAIS
ncbi:MAG: sigma-70 family RNA polymerase sigma factor [Verrucomicrobiota bacterium]